MQGGKWLGLALALGLGSIWQFGSFETATQVALFVIILLLGMIVDRMTDAWTQGKRIEEHLEAIRDEVVKRGKQL